VIQNFVIFQRICVLIYIISFLGSSTLLRHVSNILIFFADGRLNSRSGNLIASQVLCTTSETLSDFEKINSMAFNNKKGDKNSFG
jgi:hypothetical protein